MARAMKLGLCIHLEELTSTLPSILFIYSQYHDNIYIQVYTCANGLDVGIAYICPLQLVRQFKCIYTHIVMQLQKLQVVQIHVYIYKVLVIGMNMNVNSNR